MDDTHAYILMDCEGGNPVSAQGVGGNVPMVTVESGPRPCMLGDTCISIQHI